MDPTLSQHQSSDDAAAGLPGPQPIQKYKSTKGSNEVLLPGNDSEPSRRAFLRMTGFGIASATLSGCSRAPAGKLIPYLNGSETITAGRSYWVATTCAGCSASCGVLARCRDGRPVKLEGNTKHGLSKGGLCSVGQSEILSVYDSKRLALPVSEGSTVDWATADRDMQRKLEEVRAKGGNLRLLTGTVHSPSTLSAIGRFLETQGNAEHIAYDALSVSALQEAHLETHGVRAVPAFRFDRARTVVSFGADFLGTWISPVQFASDYAAARQPDKSDGGERRGDGQGAMSQHIQFESILSLTGSAADVRTRLAPWEEAGALAALCDSLEQKAGSASRMQGKLAECRTAEPIQSAAAALWKARGQALVVAGANDLQVQRLAAYANHLLDSYGSTLSMARPSLQARGSDRDLMRLQVELEAGQVDLLIIADANPAYDLPKSFSQALLKAGSLVVLSSGLDETSAMAGLRLPSAHALESWNDAEPETGRLALCQPTLPAVRKSRTLRHVLSGWMGDARGDRDLLRAYWQDSGLHTKYATPGQSFQRFFDQVLHDGYVEMVEAAAEPAFQLASIQAPASIEPPTGLTLVLYPKVSMLAGSHAHNPWLQELPDPVSKITWDNYACVSPERAEQLSLQEGDVVRIAVPDTEGVMELPLHIQRGQHDDVVAVALGYGRLGTDRFAGVGPDWIEATATIESGQTLGVNAAPFSEFRSGQLRRLRIGASIAPTGAHASLASVQDHHSMEVPPHVAPKRGKTRDVVQTVEFDDYRAHPEHAVHEHPPSESDLWVDDHEAKHHHWGMAVDLASCTGCSACMVSCQAENNVPVVGRDEVLRHREMHWMRIDRYLDGDDDSISVAHQPMFCQQCDNAPCEGVCPVLATVHSSEGLNQQVYNRCVGTRYCANTCPYKVRRFNWFDYPREDELQNHSLNPDVTVRSRGVMEKCSFCAQRIQEAKSEAKAQGLPLADGDIKVACQQSCPTSAIVFGDTNDPESEVSHLMARQRSYGVLTELNVKPSVRYLARVRNTNEGDSQHG